MRNSFHRVSTVSARKVDEREWRNECVKMWWCSSRSLPHTICIHVHKHTHTQSHSFARSLALSASHAFEWWWWWWRHGKRAVMECHCVTCYGICLLPSTRTHTHTYIHTHWVRDDGMKCYADASAMCFLSILLTHSALYLHPSNRSTSHTLQYQFQYVLLLPLPATTHSQCCRSLAATAVVVVSPLSCKCPDCPLNVFFYITLHFSLTHSVLFSSFIVRAM